MGLLCYNWGMNRKPYQKLSKLQRQKQKLSNWAYKTTPMKLIMAFIFLMFFWLQLLD